MAIKIPKAIQLHIILKNPWLFLLSLLTSPNETLLILSRTNYSCLTFHRWIYTSIYSEHFETGKTYTRSVHYLIIKKKRVSKGQGILKSICCNSRQSDVVVSLTFRPLHPVGIAVANLFPQTGIKLSDWLGRSVIFRPCESIRWNHGHSHSLTML